MLVLGLIIAITAVTANCQVCSNPFQVSSGDTYCLVAQICGCPSWQSVASVNPYPATDIPVPSQLTIPSSCTGTPSCKNVPINWGDTYNSIAANYQVNVDCLLNINCNATLYAGNQICIPTSPSCSAATTAAPTTTTPEPVLNGFVNGNFYCNSILNNTMPQSASLQNCGGQWYSYGAPVNGWQGQYFYCNGYQTTVVTQTCAGLYYVNGMPLTGNNGTSFYCNGIYYGPSNQLYTCNGIDYYNGAIASGWINGGWYCNGQGPSQPSISLQVCGGTYYQNGMGYTGLLNGIYYQNGNKLYDCSQSVFVGSSSPCSLFLSNISNTNNIMVTQAQVIACNPNLNLNATNCQLPAGWINY